MRIDIPPAFLAHVQGDETSTAICWYIEKGNGEFIRGTEHDENITIDPTGDSPESELVGFYPAGANIRTSALQSGAEMAPDNMDVDGAVPGPVTDYIDVSVADIEAGLLNQAPVTVFLTNWKVPNDGQAIYRRGFLGEIARDSDGKYSTEVRGLLQLLVQVFIETYSERCMVKRLGDERCKINVGPFTHTGTVTSVTSRKAFATTIDPDEDRVGVTGTITGVSCANLLLSINNALHVTTGLAPAACGIDGEQAGLNTANIRAKDGTQDVRCLTNVTRLRITSIVDPDHVTAVNADRAGPLEDLGMLPDSDDWRWDNGLPDVHKHTWLTRLNSTAKRKSFMLMPDAVTLETIGHDLRVGDVIVSTATGDIMTWASTPTMVTSPVPSDAALNTGTRTATPDDASPVAFVGETDYEIESAALGADYRGGEFTFLTGDNAGYTRESKSAAFTFWEPFPNDVQIGDTFQVIEACNRQWQTCKGRFGNLVNFRGYGLFIPGIDALMKGPT